MRNAFRIAVAATLAAAGFAAQAAPARWAPAGSAEIDQRQARQEQRIERAFARGDITRHQFHQLRSEQREIARAEARAKADGRLTRFELRDLNAMLDRADQNIRRARIG